MKFDYIIAGGGTSGLLLANRLSADPKTTVAVIEPGSDVRTNPNVTDPDNPIYQAALNTPIDWAYPTTPQLGAGGRTLELHSGKAVGGTSTINGMAYIRADAAEIDAWEALGNEGWNWESLLPYYKRVEKFTPPTAAQAAAGSSYEAEFHGEDGLLHVGNLYFLPNGSFHGTVQDAWESLGYVVNPDVNGGVTRGFNVWPMTVDRDADLRWDAARAYYYPAENRTNLVVLRGTVTKLVWEAHERGEHVLASGVEYVDAKNSTTVVAVRKEVILSAGSLRTPLILEASGVGNPQILAKLNIETVIDLPGVGENLQEQPNSVLGFNGNLSVTGYPTYATFGTADDIFGPDRADLADETAANLTHYARNIASASGAGLNATAIEQVLRIQHDLMFAKNVTIGETITVSASGGLFATAHWLLLPFSRGSVHLDAVGEINRPVIDPRYFLVDFDLTLQIAIGKQAHAFWHSAPMSGYITSNFTADPASNEEWAAYIKNSFTPNYHPIGTAAMMSRELGGVVDKDLKVYQTSNVRVVDASVLPLQVSGHPTSTLYAVAERASDLIRTYSQD